MVRYCEVPRPLLPVDAIDKWTGSSEEIEAVRILDLRHPRPHSAEDSTRYRCSKNMASLCHLQIFEARLGAHGELAGRSRWCRIREVVRRVDDGSRSAIDDYLAPLLTEGQLWRVKDVVQGVDRG